MQSIVTTTKGSQKGAGGTPQPSADLPLDGRSKARSLRVVVADGDPALHQFYQHALTRLGHQVCLALTGRQLVEQCRSLRPDLVITDIQMPDLDGIAAAEQVCREQPTPIILVPGNHEAESVQPALANQFILACLFKPIKEVDLGTAIALAMCRFEQFQSLRQEAADLRQALEDRKLIERAKGIVMRFVGVDEEDAYRRLRKLASDQNRKLIEVAQAVLAAGEVFQQLEQPPHDRKAGNRHTWNANREQRTHQPRNEAVGRMAPRCRTSAPNNGEGSG